MSNKEQHIVPIELLTRYFSGESTEEDNQQVNDWKEKSPENKKEFNSLQKLWNITGNAPDKAERVDLDAEWDRMSQTINGSKKTITLSRIIQIAAAIIIISGLSFIGIDFLTKESVTSEIASMSTINLPDGSVITLNAKSKVSYNKNFGENNREVTLKGEAYFEVAKNDAIPFVVSANKAQVRVVGTKFNIKAYKKQQAVKVSVTEGKVLLSEVGKDENNTLLKAGETGIYQHKEKAISKEPDLDKNDIAWKTKVLRFDNTILQEVADVLSNTYHLEIIVAEKVRNCKITVEFDNQELEAVLKVLKSTLDLSYTIRENKLYISGQGC